MTHVKNGTKLNLAGAILYGQTTQRDNLLEMITGLRMTDRAEKWKAVLADTILRGDAELYDELMLPMKAMPSLEERYANLPQGFRERWGYTSYVPTAEEFDALPSRVRQYIHDLEANCDPSGMVRENTIARDTCRALEIELAEKDPKTDGN